MTTLCTQVLNKILCIVLIILATVGYYVRNIKKFSISRLTFPDLSENRLVTERFAFLAGKVVTPRV